MKKLNTSQLVTISIILNDHLNDLKKDINSLKEDKRENAQLLKNLYVTESIELQEIIDIIESYQPPYTISSLVNIDTMSEIAGLNINKDNK